MENIQELYERAIETWNNNSKESWIKDNKAIANNLHEIINRGFWLCLDNPEKGILLSGINPSYDSKHEKVDNIPFRICSGRYWNRWKRNLETYISQNKAGYIDLFPLRVSKQKEEFEKYVPLELKAEILRVTQKEIERLRPQLIIHANKTSSFYYGTNPMYPWMGYDLEPLELPIELKGKGVLYKIIGLQNNSNRINYETMHKTKLIGTYLFVCRMQNRLSKDDIAYIDQDNIIQLCRYLNIMKSC